MQREQESAEDQRGRKAIRTAVLSRQLLDKRHLIFLLPVDIGHRGGHRIGIVCLIEVIRGLQREKKTVQLGLGGGIVGGDRPQIRAVYATAQVDEIQVDLIAREAFFYIATRLCVESCAAVRDKYDCPVAVVRAQVPLV